MSKSIGNVISPQKIWDTMGSDVLRAWIASTDYTKEIVLSDDILKRTSDSYRRIRNTVRFLLGNLKDKKNDFDAPHFIGIPEIPIKEDYFLSEIRYAYNTHGYAVAVIAENVRGLGNTAKNQKPYFTDSFGHEYYDGPARYLATLVIDVVPFE